MPDSWPCYLYSWEVSFEEGAILIVTDYDWVLMIVDAECEAIMFFEWCGCEIEWRWLLVADGSLGECEVYDEKCSDDYDCHYGSLIAVIR